MHTCITNIQNYAMVLSSAVYTHIHACMHNKHTESRHVCELCDIFIHTHTYIHTYIQNIQNYAMFVSSAIYSHTHIQTYIQNIQNYAMFLSSAIHAYMHA